MKMKRVRTPKISLQDWNLDAIDDLVSDFERGIRQMTVRIANEVMEHAIKGRVMGFLEFSYEDGDGKSPLVLGITLPISDEDREPKWTVDIGEAIVESYEAHQAGLNGPIIGQRIRRDLATLRDELRRHADQIDAALAVKDTSE